MPLDDSRLTDTDPSEVDNDARRTDNCNRNPDLLDTEKIYRSLKMARRKRTSNKNFRRTAKKVHGKNHMTPMRGGIRI